MRLSWNGKQLELFDVLDEDGKKTEGPGSEPGPHGRGSPQDCPYMGCEENKDKTYDLLLQKEQGERIPILAVMTFPRQAMCRPVMNSAVRHP